MGFIDEFLKDAASKGKGTIVVTKKHDDASGSEFDDASGSEFDDAVSDFVDAVKGDDKEGAASALKAAIELCSDNSDPDETDDAYDGE